VGAAVLLRFDQGCCVVQVMLHVMGKFRNNGVVLTRCRRRKHRYLARQRHFENMYSGQCLMVEAVSHLPLVRGSSLPLVLAWQLPDDSTFYPIRSALLALLAQARRDVQPSFLLHSKKIFGIKSKHCPPHLAGAHSSKSVRNPQRSWA
jgi:hypothetical protein